MAYDQAERLTTTTDPATNIKARVLDQAGNVTELQENEVSPDGTRSTVPHFTTFDALGRPREQRDALGNVTTLVHDARSQLRRQTDPTNQFIQYAYDGLNRPVEELKPHGIKVTRQYDLASRQTRYVDALGGTTQWDYDALSRPTQVTYADALAVTYQYDEASNRTEWIDQRGTQVTQTFDAANRPTISTVVPAAGDTLVGPVGESFSWDGLNRRTQLVSGTISTDLKWDSVSRLRSDTTNGRAIVYAHDAVGNTTGVTYPSGYSLSKGFDPLNRVASITNAGDGSTVATYGYRGPYALQSKTVGSLTTETSFDAARRPVSLETGIPGGPPVLSETIRRDQRGLKTAIARNDLGGAGRVMAHDGAHRLVSSAKLGQPLSLAAPNATVDPAALASQPDTFAYSYDVAMNQLASIRTENGVSTSRSTPNDGSGRNRPASVDGVALTYDANGNLTQKGDMELSYDFRNRLTRVEHNGTTVAEYAYDALNRRVTRQVGGVVEETMWDGWQAIETQRDGALLNQRVYGAEIDETVQFSRDTNSDGAIDSTLLTMSDSTNSLAVVTNLAGKPIERYEASPFGERRILVDSVPPDIEQVRVVGGALWIELSEAVLGETLQSAVTAGTLRLRNTVAGEDLAITVDQPVREGGQALCRVVITPNVEPSASTSLELIVDAGVLVDTFANTPSADYVLPFGWPATNAVITDTAAPEVAAVIVREGVVEIEFTEEVHPTSSAISLDGASMVWTVSDDRYTLTADSVLATGSHTLDVTTSALDLAGTGLETAFQTTFTVEPQGAKSAFVAPDEREVAASTIGNDVGFHGRPVDPATGLVYFRNRWFDPDLGRFISPDPLGFVDGPSMYQFAGYSPANYGDPLGLYIVGGIKELFVLKQTLRKAGASDLAKVLRLESREIPERFGRTSRKPEEERIAIIDRSRDWTRHPNRIAQLIAKAIETGVRIEFSLTSKDLSKTSGGVTKSRDQLAIPYFDPLRSDSENYITIELNPNQILDARVSSFNAHLREDVRISVPLEAAVVHELGHAYWLYELRNTAPTAFDKSGTNKEAVDWENVYRDHLGLPLRSWH